MNNNENMANTCRICGEYVDLHYDDICDECLASSQTCDFCGIDVSIYDTHTFNYKGRSYELCYSCFSDADYNYNYKDKIKCDRCHDWYRYLYKLGSERVCYYCIEGDMPSDAIDRLQRVYY